VTQGAARIRVVPPTLLEDGHVDQMMLADRADGLPVAIVAVVQQPVAPERDFTADRVHIHVDDG